MRIRTLLGPPLPHEVVRATATILVLSNKAQARRQIDVGCGTPSALDGPDSFGAEPEHLDHADIERPRVRHRVGEVV